jgi:AcrR family transcriptional regulator
MSRPRKYDDEQILRAAADVFLERGPAAGTALIAKRAGVSEGVLFKRFKTKEALFEAALTSDRDSNNWRRELMESTGKGTPRGNLKKAILALFDKLQRLVPRLMVLEGRGHLRTLPSGAKTPPLEDASAIAAYLRSEMKLGRLKINRPELHAHEIVGAVVHCTMLKLRHETTLCHPRQWADHLAEIHVGNARGTRTRQTSTSHPG